MAEGLKVEESVDGIIIYTVFDPRISRWVGGGFFDTNTLIYHKFCTKESEMQRKCNGKPLGGFGIQENVYQDIKERGCTLIFVHFAPTRMMHGSTPRLWDTVGQKASYSGLQRFAGIMTLPVTARLAEAKEGKGKPLTIAEIRKMERDGKQMSIEPDVVPSWFGALIVKEVPDGTK